MSSEVTQLLRAVQAGEPGAWDALIPLVYEELRVMAARRIACEQPGITLQATALVSEAYLRLLGPDGATCDFKTRRHFFAAAAEAMRRILVDRARARNAQKRKGGRRREALPEHLAAEPEDPDEILALHEALVRMEQLEPEVAEVVRLRFFVGLTGEEVAEVIGQSPRQVDRIWSYARAWLYRAVAENQSP